jgi:crossover junction endodeoxyribonuclease RuvC
MSNRTDPRAQREDSDMSIVMGIDPSLTGTGIVVLRHGTLEFADTTKNQPELGTIERVKRINETIMYVIENLTSDDESEWKPPTRIVIEGFSYGSKGRGVFSIAYLGFRIREELERLRIKDKIPWIEVSPSQLKQFATGKGNAGKEIILQQVYKRWGFEAKDNNQADAYVLAQIGRAYLGEVDDLTDFQQKVVRTLKKEA